MREGRPSRTPRDVHASRRCIAFYFSHPHPSFHHYFCRCERLKSCHGMVLMRSFTRTVLYRCTSINSIPDPRATRSKHYVTVQSLYSTSHEMTHRGRGRSTLQYYRHRSTVMYSIYLRNHSKKGGVSILQFTEWRWKWPLRW